MIMFPYFLLKQGLTARLIPSMSDAILDTVLGEGKMGIRLFLRMKEQYLDSIHSENKEFQTRVKAYYWQGIKYLEG
jgi:hypothetical protein